MMTNFDELCHPVYFLLITLKRSAFFLSYYRTLNMQGLNVPWNIGTYQSHCQAGWTASFGVVDLTTNIIIF